MVIGLARASGRLGCECTLGVFRNAHRPNTEVGDLARLQGLPVEIIPCKSRVHWDAVRAIRKYVKTYDIDIIHTHGYKADVYGYFAARRLGTPLLATCHAWAGRTTLLGLYGLLDHTVLRRFHRIVAVSDAVAASLRGFGIPHDRIATISNGVDVSAFRNARPTLVEAIPKGKRMIVGTVARLVPLKGIEYLLRAAREVLADFPNTLFVLAGDGPSRKQLEELARELGIASKVRFVGERRDMRGVYASMDIFVLPSLNEGMPMAILEAFAAGKPVIATSVGGVPKVVLHEQTGLLVQPVDTFGLRNAIVRLLTDSDLRSQLGAKGQALVERHFSVEAMALEYRGLYERLVEKCVADIITAALPSESGLCMKRR
jgi:glycosyltransferase involved in cell wall biosynthesis